MKQKHVGILYLLYFLLFLVDCYATRISLYSSIGEGYGLAASLSHVLGACLLYWSQRDARRRACPFCFRGFNLAFVLFGILGSRAPISRSHLRGRAAPIPRERHIAHVPPAAGPGYGAAGPAVGPLPGHGKGRAGAVGLYRPGARRARLQK